MKDGASPPTRGRPRDLPVLAHGACRACLGSPTAQGPPTARASRRQRHRLPPRFTASAPRTRTFRGSIAPPTRPLSTLRCALTERQRMTRGHRGSLILRCRAFTSPSPCRFIPALSKPGSPAYSPARRSGRTEARPDGRQFVLANKTRRRLAHEGRTASERLTRIWIARPWSVAVPVAAQCGHGVSVARVGVGAAAGDRPARRPAALHPWPSVFF